ncbi:Homeobox-leucine zipper protein ATHB-52 [Linum grandiflorum]
MKRPQKKRLTQEQVRVLERSFSFNKKLVPELKSELATQLGVPPRQVAIWYQNKRARWKTQTLELDHNTLELKLQNAAAHKRRLEREVARLHHELKKAQDTVFAFMNHCRHGGCTSSTTPPLFDHHFSLPPPSNLEHHQRYEACPPPMQMDPCGSTSSDQLGSSRFNFNNNHGAASQRNTNAEEVLQLEDELYASFVSSGSTSSWD